MVNILKKYWFVFLVALIFVIKIVAINNLFLPVEYSFVGPDPSSFYLVETLAHPNEQKQFFRMKKIAGDMAYRQLSVLVPVSYVNNHPDAKIVLKVGQNTEERLLNKFNKKAFQAKDGDYIKVNFPSKKLLLDSRGYDLFTNISLFNLFISILCNALLVFLFILLIFRKNIFSLVSKLDKRILWLAGISFLLRLPWVFLLRFSSQWIPFYYDTQTLTQIGIFPESLLHYVSPYGMSVPLLLAPVIKAISYLFVWWSPLLLDIDIWMSAAVLTGFISAIFGAGTIIMLYLLVKKLWGEKAGFIAALLLFFDFSQLVWSTTSAPDIAAGFLLLLNFYYFFTIKDKGTVYEFFKLSMLTALLIGTKLYNGIFMVIPFLGLGWDCLQKKGKSRLPFCRDAFIKLFVYIFFSITFLILSNPYIITSDYISSLFSPRYMDGIVLEKIYTWHAFVYQIRNIYFWFNKPLLLIAAFGLLLAALRPSFNKFLLLLFLILNFLFFRERMAIYYLATWVPLFYGLASTGLVMFYRKNMDVLLKTSFWKSVFVFFAIIIGLAHYYLNVIKSMPSDDFLGLLLDGETIGCAFIVNENKDTENYFIGLLSGYKGNYGVTALYGQPDYILSSKSIENTARFIHENNVFENEGFNYKKYFKYTLFERNGFSRFIGFNDPFVFASIWKLNKVEASKRFDFIVNRLPKEYSLVNEYKIGPSLYEINDKYFIYKRR